MGNATGKFKSCYRKNFEGKQKCGTLKYIKTKLSEFSRAYKDINRGGYGIQDKVQ